MGKIFRLVISKNNQQHGREFFNMLVLEFMITFNKFEGSISIVKTDTDHNHLDTTVICKSNSKRMERLRPLSYHVF